MSRSHKHNSDSRNSSGDSKSLRERMSQDLQLQGKAQRTRVGYLREIRKLACFYNLAPDKLSQQQVADYLLHLIDECQFAPGSLKVTYSALKFFYRTTCPRDWDCLEKLRVPKQKTLPDVLTIEQVHQLIAEVRLHHHAAFCWTLPGRSLYAASCSTRYPSGFIASVTTAGRLRTASSSSAGCRCWFGSIGAGVG